MVTRRTCAARTLNFPDRRALLRAPFGSSLFGDEWDESMLQEELHWRRFAAEARFLRGRRRQGSTSRGSCAGHSQARAGQPAGRPTVRADGVLESAAKVAAWPKPLWRRGARGRRTCLAWSRTAGTRSFQRRFSVSRLTSHG